MEVRAICMSNLDIMNGRVKLKAPNLPCVSEQHFWRLNFWGGRHERLQGLPDPHRLQIELK